MKHCIIYQFYQFTHTRLMQNIHTKQFPLPCTAKQRLLRMNETLCTAGVLLLAIGLVVPSYLHLRGHGDHIFGTWLSRPVARLAFPGLDDGKGLIVRPSGEVGHVVKVITPRPAGSGAVVVPTASGRAADELWEKPRNQGLERGSTGSNKR